jgi:hypothetical protein
MFTVQPAALFGGPANYAGARGHATYADAAVVARRNATATGRTYYVVGPDGATPVRPPLPARYRYCY